MKTCVLFKKTALIVLLFTFLYIYGFSQTNVNSSKFLTPTVIINSDHSNIKEKAEELTEGYRTREEKAKKLFEYVRDLDVHKSCKSMVASDILKNNGTFSCYQRSILLSALCRSLNIPARLHWQEVIIKNWKDKNGEISDNSFLHGITGIQLNSKWYLYEPSGSKDKWAVWIQSNDVTSENTVKFYPDRDCLFLSTDKVQIKTLPVWLADYDDTLVEKILIDKFCSKEEEDLSEFLKPGEYVNSDHPDIIKKAEELTEGRNTDAEKSKVIYEFVRDNYNDNVFESKIASDVLKLGGNSCTQRSILLAALCRAAGIPARLHLQYCILKNYKYDNGEVKDSPFMHGITGIYINGEWHLYESVGNEAKWIIWTQDESRGIEMPVKFYPNRDCLFKSDEKVKIFTLPVYFKDRTEEMKTFIEKIYNGDVGFFRVDELMN